MNDAATTVLEWAFEPQDLFEEPIDIEMLCGSVHIEQGVALGKFPAHEYERGAELREEAHRHLEPHFLSQAIFTGKRLVLNPARLTREYPDGRRDATVIVASGNVVLPAMQISADVVIRNKDGTITTDTRAERIAEQTDFRSMVVEAIPDHPEIKGMAESLNNSFEDEENCFVHLFEVLDRIKTKPGGQKEAKGVLSVKDDWNTVGNLSNDPENQFGRHRGEGTNHKKPDQDTLRKGRDATRRIIIAYVNHISRR